MHLHCICKAYTYIKVSNTSLKVNCRALKWMETVMWGGNCECPLGNAWDH